MNLQSHYYNKKDSSLNWFDISEDVIGGSNFIDFTVDMGYGGGGKLPEVPSLANYSLEFTIPTAEMFIIGASNSSTLYSYAEMDWYFVRYASATSFRVGGTNAITPISSPPLVSNYKIVREFGTNQVFINGVMVHEFVLSNKAYYLTFIASDIGTITNIKLDLL